MRKAFTAGNIFRSPEGKPFRSTVRRSGVYCKFRTAEEQDPPVHTSVSPARTICHS